jgi:hypothetical protein
MAFRKYILDVGILEKMWITVKGENTSVFAYASLSAFGRFAAAHGVGKGSRRNGALD